MEGEGEKPAIRRKCKGFGARRQPLGERRVDEDGYQTVVGRRGGAKILNLVLAKEVADCSLFAFDVCMSAAGQESDGVCFGDKNGVDMPFNHSGSQ